MKALKVEGTDETPQIILDKENGLFEISGRSLPEDSAEFFDPILAWVREYHNNPNSSTNVILKLDYLNTASSKFLQDILQAFEKLPETRIIWYHLDDDESMEEIGRDYAELVDVPFEFRVYS